MTAFVLVHSPLVGPATCAPLADELRSGGHRMVLPSLLDTLRLGPPWVDHQVRAYDGFLADARSRGWRNASLDARHLSPATDPVAVADAMLQLVNLDTLSN